MPTIFIDPGSYNCRNFGDFAMLQVAVARWKAMWPLASVDIVTNAPEALRSLGANVNPLSVEARSTWLQAHLLGRFHRLLPSAAAASVEAGERRLKMGAARPFEQALTLKRRLGGGDAESLTRLLHSLRRAEVIMSSGAGIMTDAFFDNASAILDTFEIAIRRPPHSRPVTAMFGQGFGPLDHPALRRKAAAVLPHIDLIAVRERRASLPLLLELGVRPEQIIVTGDDAIELAYERRKPGFERGIGVNVRVAYYANTDRSVLSVVRDALQAAARRYGVPLVPVPISLQEGGIDAAAIRELLAGHTDSSDGGASLKAPVEVIDQVGRCRVVVTGSYHGAVFALAQGIPAIALVRSQYYENKFLGLADQFGGGLELVHMDVVDFRERLDGALECAWRTAEQKRPALLEAAVRQIALSRSAHSSVADRAMSKRRPAPAVASSLRPDHRQRAVDQRTGHP
jgi:polysaccharide pyruvyl transferase WcaK-like protein